MQWICLPAKIERKEEADARRRLRGIVNRRRRVDRLRALIHRPVPTPVAIALRLSLVPAFVLVPLTIGAECRCYGHTAHHRSNGECHHDLADCWPEIPGLICRGFHCALSFLSL